MLEKIIILGLLNTTLLICFHKWKWLEWYNIHRLPFLPEANCYLCISFWMGLFESVYFITNDLHMIIVPFCAAAITNYLTNIAFLHDYGNRRN